MALINITINLPGDIAEIQQTLKRMGDALNDLKAVVDSQNAKLDVALPLIDAIAGDVTYLKKKLDEGVTKGLSPAEVAELAAYMGGTSDKITETADKLKALDDQTDSTQP